MNAKEKMLQYASQHNTTKFYTLTNEEFVGKMVEEGVVIARSSNQTTTARARREGKTIIVTETHETTDYNVIDGVVSDNKHVETEEIFRVEIQ